MKKKNIKYIEEIEFYNEQVYNIFGVMVPVRILIDRNSGYKWKPQTNIKRFREHCLLLCRHAYMSQAKKNAFCPRICKTRSLGHSAPFILSPADGWITSLAMGAKAMNWGGDRRTNGHTIQSFDLRSGEERETGGLNQEAFLERI